VRRRALAANGRGRPSPILKSHPGRANTVPRKFRCVAGDSMSFAFSDEPLWRLALRGRGSRVLQISIAFESAASRGQATARIDFQPRIDGSRSGLPGHFRSSAERSPKGAAPVAVGQIVGRERGRNGGFDPPNGSPSGGYRARAVAWASKGLRRRPGPRASASVHPALPSTVRMPCSMHAPRGSHRGKDAAESQKACDSGQQHFRRWFFFGCFFWGCQG